MMSNCNAPDSAVLFLQSCTSLLTENCHAKPQTSADVPLTGRAWSFSGWRRWWIMSCAA